MHNNISQTVENQYVISPAAAVDNYLCVLHKWLFSKSWIIILWSFKDSVMRFVKAEELEIFLICRIKI